MIDLSKPLTIEQAAEILYSKSQKPLSDESILDRADCLLQRHKALSSSAALALGLRVHAYLLMRVCDPGRIGHTEILDALEKLMGESEAQK